MIRAADYECLERFMVACMGDSAHDREHIYRVLFVALDIASREPDVDYDVLIAACLLHDIGRGEQFENPELCHAVVGAEKAERFLAREGFSDSFARRVGYCIRAHRFRTSRPPVRVEEKILFDADKIDVTGAIGIARTLFYKGQVGEPLYSVNENGGVSDGKGDAQPSFFQEYKYKLEGLYGQFFTERGREIALARQGAAVAFYENMLREVSDSYELGAGLLAGMLD